MFKIAPHPELCLLSPLLAQVKKTIRIIIFLLFSTVLWCFRTMKEGSIAYCNKTKGTIKDMCEIDLYFSVACYHNHATSSL